MLGPSLVVNILQTPTLGAARTCDEPGSGEEVCHWVRRAGQGRWAKLRSRDLLAGRSWPSSFLPSSAMLSGELMECGRQGMRLGDAGVTRRVDGSMGVEEAQVVIKVSECQSVRLRSCCASSPLPAVANPASEVLVQQYLASSCRKDCSRSTPGMSVPIDHQRIHHSHAGGIRSTW